jgi:hypothetical protein
MKKQSTSVLFFVMLFVAVSAFGRQLTGPAFGFVWSDSDGKLRPLLGMPGNTTVGDVRNTEFAIVQAFSLNGQHFLASTDSSPSVLVINAATSPVSATPIADAPAQPSAIAGSRAGTTAALYYADQQRVLILTGLLATPRVSYTADVSVTGHVSRMAISDDGNLLLYSVAQKGNDAGREALFGWTPGGGYRMLTTSDSISAISFTPTGDALFADAQTNEVFFLLQPKGDAVRTFVADGKNGVSNPVGVAATDNGQIYVANAGSGSILALDSNGLLLRSQHCYCEIGGLFPLKNSLYRLSGRTDGTLYLLETSATGGRVVFVPPYRKNQ